MRSGFKIARVARITVAAGALAGMALLQGCASTLGNIALGAGLGVTVTVSAIYCALACH
ncbi:hypothetical protein F4827_004344 [Paraburkholderia bannensis]|uniref:Lipoprotein n=1 Tax=Paraburkholderia bannensis TaxID=765414 RepID=A0A7W9U273_9BURK|nr:MULTISPECIES: hypothetical protein [Paraburkholderia]MBB3259469.1 hypothetical protein [Paraburkholderia sp. WP4_3_2]MBB6104485.1 hypothetical protein [Paraburkholderia bannensis]